MSARPTADLLVRAARVRTMDLAAAAGPVTALAVRDGKIADTAGPGHERDLLAAWQGPDSVVLDDAGLVVLPAFVDTHNHLMLAARNVLGVPVSRACDISGVVGLIRERAAQTPPGRWIITAADWHELQLAERRLPTAAELHAIDRAEALRLYTVAGAQFLGRPATATLVPGAPADLVGYPEDPFTCPAERLLNLAPAATVVGGELTHDER
jgi:predicted amidohydrolase YtcJ